VSATTQKRHGADESMQITDGQFVLAELPYSYSALEPAIDAETMKLHHDKHHRAYVDGLNHAVSEAPALSGLTIQDLLREVRQAPSLHRTDIHNMGGGHFNHNFFWSCMSPARAGEMPRSVAKALAAEFGSTENFMERFLAAGVHQFGSGWVWLCVNEAANQGLEIVTFANQDTWVGSPLRGLLTCDVWEHAYYLRYRNRRADWLKQWWQVVDWQGVEERFHNAMDWTAGTESG
jgi:superoxide dismutase, Fe-Mn family